jgi:heme-degrading monooxygenase HmoA
MYARVSTVKDQPERRLEAVQVCQDSVIPALRTQRGFEGALLLTQPDSGQGISITLWSSSEDQLASEATGFYREQLAKFAGLFTVAPIREVYEVNASVRPDARKLPVGELWGHGSADRRYLDAAIHGCEVSR